MSINIMARNLEAMNAERMTGINSGKKRKITEKLSSGYRINRAADDAAGLAISEGMRRMIRGLNQGTANAKNGISWVQIGDGALDEVHSILHRMTELTVKSLNGTWQDADRALMQVEFDQLQSEIDRLSDSAIYNERHIFADHEYPYYQFEGNVKWPQDEIHVVTSDANDLNISYQIDENSPVQEATITVPPGKYTTQELVDEIDTALEKSGLKEQGLVLEYTSNGFCNLNIEGGISLNKVGGGLEYLIHDMYEGGSMGALIGTTIFRTEYSSLSIYKDINDSLSFDIVNLDGTTTHKDIKLPATDGAGRPGYTKEELLNLLNNELSDTSVQATTTKDGLSIKLESDDSIITNLKGNMFKVDYAEKGDTVATSVFYDNVGYGPVEPCPGSFKGGTVLTTNSIDAEHMHFHIDSSNDTLLIQPNGSASATSLQIAHGDYTAEEMRDALNKLFGDNSLDLKTEVYADPTNQYRGLMITSGVKGPESKVGIDPASSAYNTLFVTRAYNQTEIPETYTYDSKPDVLPYFRGGKPFTSSTLPLTIEAGKNDKFMLNVGIETGSGTASATTTRNYTITLSAGKYDTLSDLSSAVLDAIKKAADVLPAGKEKTALQSIKVSDYGSALQLTTDSKEINTLTASAIAGNTGYADLFTTYTSYTYVTATSQNGVVTLDTPISYPAEITAATEKMVVNLNNKNETVTIPQGKYDNKDDLLKAVNDALPKARTEYVNNTFSTVTNRGTYNTFQKGPVKGTTTPPSQPQKFTSTGDSDSPQGSTEPPTRSTPASVSFNFYSNGLPMKIEAGKNDTLNIKVNGVTKQIKLDAGTYNTTGDIARNLQDKLNDAFGKNFGGVTVTSTSSKITLTTNLKDANDVLQDGKLTNIECSTADSSFLYDVRTQRSAAAVELNALNSSIVLTNSDTFIFSYKQPGDSAAKTITISNLGGTYSPREFCNKLNEQLKSMGVTASLKYGSYGPLILTAATPGEGYEIGYDSTKGGTCVEKVFSGVDASPKAASITIGQVVQEKFTPEAGKTDFSFNVNGQTKTVKLTAGKEYTRATFVSEINKQLSSDVTASLNTSNQLVLTTKATGTGASISASYDSGSTSAMPAVFGKTPVNYSGLKAEFTNDGKLKLTAVDKDGKTVTGSTIRVSSQNGSIFQTKRNENKQTASVSSQTGYHSKIYSSINGAPLEGSSVTIDKWNKELNFRYYNGSNTQYISLEVDEKTYTFAELQTELQNKLDAAAGKGVLKAEVTSGGVKILAGNPGSRYFFENRNSRYSASGGFYYNVLRRAPEKKVATKPVVENGYYDATVFSMGRKDVRHNTTEITKGINDTLTMDFTYGNTVVPISLSITPGRYSGGALVKELQKKLNEQLTAKGLPENLIEVEIGTSGITLPKDLVGYNNNSLTFKLSKTAKLPQDNVEYKIDGVGGNAAFSIFYQTDGDMKIAYSRGTKNISKGVTVPEDSTLSFDVDGVNYEVTVPAGKYTADEILQTLNGLFKNKVPVTAHMENGTLQLMHTKYGKHQITNVSGDARRYLFFDENGKKSGEEKIWIRLSSSDGDGIAIERPVMNTVSLGINSITISKTQYAEKALSQLKSATIEVSGIRTMFGTMQNRLEHKVNSNENAAENTQAAESLIRDTDIAEEIMELSVNQILEQASQAMLTQANQTKALVLSLLQ